MKKAAALLLLLGLAGCGKSEAERAVAALLPDPQSARFQHVAARGDHVCGEVNTARPDSRYRRFVYDSTRRSAMLEPAAPSAPVPPDSANPACRKPQSYQTVAERFDCGSAPERLAEHSEHAAFEAQWSKACAR